MDKINENNEIDGYKEFYNLNGYYLKIFYQNHIIGLVGYNSNALDGIKYEKKINHEEIKKKRKNQKFIFF